MRTPHTLFQVYSKDLYKKERNPKIRKAIRDAYLHGMMALFRELSRIGEEEDVGVVLDKFQGQLEHTIKNGEKVS